ncbi:MAG: DNA mismatch repair endonuclease MutL [Verrucomicrobiia bacterium]
MNRIRLLSEQVANQIAAGEVVERPASVVKELVENALDAQAKRITVEIQAGGRGLIRVTDDGVGMSRDDALLSLERHATSKIRLAEDLSAIRTMGFRGEALPSIASVSRMTLTTRERESAEAAGTQIVIHGGRIVEVKEAGAAPGTCIEVRSLFFNLPARRKFLRSEETERAHIQHYLGLAALASPDVAMSFVDGARVVWQLPSVTLGPGEHTELAALKERLRGLYGADLRLVSVDFTSGSESDARDPGDDPCPSDAVRLWGFIGAPGVSRATREEQHIFVNRRPVENRGINYALLEGYHTALMKGRFPVCCLFLELDPAAVDVNIHPAKREVKFHQEGSVRRLVAEGVRQALLRFHSEGGGMEPVPAPGPQLAAARSEPAPVQLRAEAPEPTTPDLPAFPTTPRGPIASVALIRNEPVAVEAAPTRPEPPRLATPLVEEPPGQPLFKPAVASPVSAPPRPPSGEPVPLLQVPLRLVGVIGQLYVVLESDRGLVLLDQHAAHERILFEQTLRRLQEGNAPSQRLLLPETIELSPRDADFLREQLGCLTRMGVGLSEFGDRTFLLDALPPFVRVSDARRFVVELVDSLKAAGEGVNSWRLGEHTVAKTVCRHAVKANDALSSPELENLVSDLRQCTMPYTCPHGRPTLIEMSYRELDKKFGRSQ